MLCPIRGFRLKLIALKQSGQNFAIKNISKPAKIPQLAGHTEVVQAENKPPPPSLPKGKAKGGWVVSDKEFGTYKGFFDGVDNDKDGYVGGAEVMGAAMAMTSTLVSPMLPTQAPKTGPLAPE